MNERGMQFRVGIVVVATLFIGGVLMALFTGPIEWFDAHITIYIDAPAAPGVTKNTPVKKNGILVGRVTEVQLVDAGARITVSICTKYREKLLRSEVCRIGGGSLLGDAVVSFVADGDSTTRGDPIEDGDVLRGIVRVDPFQVVGNVDAGMERLVRSVASASSQVGALAQRLGALVQNNDAQFSRVLNHSEETLKSVRTMAENVGKLVRDPQLQEDLQRSLREMPALLREAREATAYVKQTMVSANRSFVSVQEFTGPLAKNGKGLVEHADELFRKLGRSADRMEELVENLLLFSEALNNPNGTLGKLLSESRLYDNLVSATENINRLAIEIRPVLYNARLFSDKIARHPEKLGVRGALEPSSPGSKPVRLVYPR